MRAPPASRSATRMIALRLRAFSAISRALGRTGLPTRRSFGCGRSDSRSAKPLGSAGGCDLSRMKRLTMRSSREWKLMTTSRPPA